MRPTESVYINISNWPTTKGFRFMVQLGTNARGHPPPPRRVCCWTRLGPVPPTSEPPPGLGGGSRGAGRALSVEAGWGAWALSSKGEGLFCMHSAWCIQACQCLLAVEWIVLSLVLQPFSHFFFFFFFSAKSFIVSICSKAWERAPGWLKSCLVAAERGFRQKPWHQRAIELRLTLHTSTYVFL